jgi:prephenate dehydratase
VMFVTRHEQGALVECLNVLAARNLNLTKLESRPRPGSPWEYQFYVDFEGNQSDARVQQALEELRARAFFLKVFGSYPARTTPEARVEQGPTR